MLSLFNSNTSPSCQRNSPFFGNLICLEGNELLLIHGLPFFFAPFEIPTPRRMEFESEKEPIESEDEGVDPYPLEGKYKDEFDRRE